MNLKFKAPWKKELVALGKANVNGEDKTITIRNDYPDYPVPYFQVTEGFNLRKVKELMLERNVKIAKSIANDIIIPDPAPQWVADNFLDKYAELEPILVKDSARCFLQLFQNCRGRGMSSDLTITAQTLTFIVSFNALRCAKVVLEGMAPELYGMHANPNCINKYGYFPLHEAAERFSLDMIKLLLRHGASPNVRTVGNDVIKNLLPLHVAVENTCLHKYLEDNLSRSHNHLDYIYKLIHLLCLPEMKIFLDTTRLLAAKTNNLLQELWNYIEDGKIMQSAILLLAAQEQIRGGSSSKMNGSSKKNGFDILSKCVMRLSIALKWEKGSHGMAQELLEERKTLTDCAWLLVDVISHAGEDLSAYIQAHSAVPHAEVFQHVSSVLEDYGFCPTGDLMDTINLQPYNCRKSNGESCKGLTDANMAVMESTNLDAADDKVTTVGNDGLALMARQHTTQTQAVRKKVGGGRDPTYTKRSFFPYWRSVLQARFPLKVYPAYASSDRMAGLRGQLHVTLSNKMAHGPTPTPNHKLGPMRRISPLTSNNQPRRCFVTAATGAFRLLKVLK
ncbi:hypothetical protein CFC21_060295 [Triticum aestivum]|uniref:Uncharacterized protein n=2 Tax=Triticum aestivum TaxID=4565 RepID=A0A9R1GTG7_WHEAT|nr:hypothetical protein CFC21_060295 [Triticum aestivum]